MKVFSIVNPLTKSGKTTTCYNLAAYASISNKRVLMIDLDERASLAKMAGLDSSIIRDKYSLYDVANNFKNRIYKPNVGNIDFISCPLDIAVCNIRPTNIDFQLMTISSNNIFLSNVLKQVRREYDYIFIDCPSNLGLTTLNALLVSDYVICAANATVKTIDTLNELNETIIKVHCLNKKTEFLGIIITKYEESQKDTLDMLSKNYTIIGKINKSSDINIGKKEHMPSVWADPWGQQVGYPYRKAYGNIYNSIEK